MVEECGILGSIENSWSKVITVQTILKEKVEAGKTVRASIVIQVKNELGLLKNKLGNNELQFGNDRLEMSWMFEDLQEVSEALVGFWHTGANNAQ